MADKKPKETKFSEESKAGASAPSAAMLALFKPADGPHINVGELKGVTRRNAPQMVKPGEVPIGGIVAGIIHDVIPSQKSEIKGVLLWLILANGREITFPCTGVIRNALAPGFVAPKDEDEAKTALCAYLLKNEKGKLFVAERQESKQSAKYKKEMFMFDVFTADPPKGFGEKKAVDETAGGK